MYFFFAFNGLKHFSQRFKTQKYPLFQFFISFPFFIFYFLLCSHQHSLPLNLPKETVNMFLLFFLCDLLYLTVFIFFPKLSIIHWGVRIFLYLRISEQQALVDELRVPKALSLSPSEDAMGSTWSFMCSTEEKTKSIYSTKETITHNVS